MQLIVTEPVSSEASLPRAVINVLVSRFSGPMTMETNWELSKHSINESVGPYEEHDSGDTTIDGRPWRWMVYSFASRSSPGLRMKCLVYSSFKEDRLYAITGGTSVEKFDNYRLLIERAAKSFEFGP